MNTITDHHEWEMITCSLSGTWKCRKCGKIAFGGPHDGKGYFPGRGEKVEFFLCRKKVVVIENGIAVNLVDEP